MNSINTKIALAFIALYAFFKLLLFALNLQQEIWASYVLLVLPVLTVLSVLVSLYYKNRMKEATDILQDVKICMRTTSLFAVFVALFSYAYYKWIDTSFFIIRNARMKGDGELPEFVQVFSKPFNVATLDLMVLMGVGFMSSFILAAINKKVFDRIK